MPKAYPVIAGHAPGSRTSFDAATRVEGRGKETREVMVYNAVKESPKTMWEITEHLGLPYEVVHPRCSELKGRGILGTTGETRASKYGNEQDVLKIIAPYSKKPAAPKNNNKPIKEKLKDLLANIQLINTADFSYQTTAIAIVKELLEYN